MRRNAGAERVCTQSRIRGIVAPMLVDEITLQIRAGNGGDGVTRWRQEKFKPKGGPAGGDGGRGGDVYVRAIRDINALARYTGEKSFAAGDGLPGEGGSKTGKRGSDLVIDVPVGSIVTDQVKGRRVELLHEGETVCMYKGGAGGTGNEAFKSSVNRAPEQSTKGRRGEGGELYIELSLVVDAGLIGLPNAGKSSLLNALTSAKSKIGDYAFTTKEPQLGDLYGYVLADIPGLIEGAAKGRGLGQRFLRHITRTKMLLHVVSLESTDPLQDYYTIRTELKSYNNSLEQKAEWIILSKNDLVDKGSIDEAKKLFDKISNHVFVLSAKSGEGIPELRSALVSHLRTPYNEA